MFFVQNAGAKEAGTGLEKSSIVQKIALSQAMAVSHLTDAVGQVAVETVTSEPPVINPNGTLLNYFFVLAMKLTIRYQAVRTTREISSLPAKAKVLTYPRHYTSLALYSPIMRPCFSTTTLVDSSTR